MNDYSNESICIDINDGWYVKISDDYGNIKYIEIGNNLRREISTAQEIFENDNVILPKPYVDQYGNTITWKIEDNENLYTLNDLPQEYWKEDENPQCVFHPESESWDDSYTRNYINIPNYFDETVQNF